MTRFKQILTTMTFVAGIVVLVIGIVNLSQAKNCMNKNLSSKCKANFCNANTPSTWQNCQSFAKKLLPTDITHLKPFPQQFNTDPTKYGEYAYKERERQVESAQNLGRYQGKAEGYIGIGVALLASSFVMAGGLLGLAGTRYCKNLPVN